MWKMPPINNFKGTTHDYIAFKYKLKFLECHRIEHVGMLIYSLIPEMASLRKKKGVCVHFLGVDYENTLIF